jgi:glycosyltransferase involved in cell wall biosynthesis
LISVVRILLVHNYYQQRGGEDVVVEQELALLRQRGHVAELYSVHNDSIQGLAQKAITGALVVYNPWAKAALAQKLREFRPDVVHVHNFFPKLSPSIFDACRVAGIPTVMTLHNFRILCPTSILFHDGEIRERSLTHSAIWALPQRVYKSSLLATLPLVAMVDIHKMLGTWKRKVDVFIALTDFAKAKFIEGGLEPDRIVVKGNAVADPLSGLTPNIGSRHGALFVGRLSEEKGIASLLVAWKGMNYPLRIAGDGPLRPLVEAAQAQNIIYLGRQSREQIYAEMQRAAFFLLPSVCYEMFPMTLAEAYANGLPVLASNLGGLKSLLDDGTTGLAFKPADPVDIRAKARWAIEHPNEMAAMGKTARARYEAQYTADQNYANLMRIYERALAKNVAP